MPWRDESSPLYTTWAWHAVWSIPCQKKPLYKTQNYKHMELQLVRDCKKVAARMREQKSGLFTSCHNELQRCVATCWFEQAKMDLREF